MKTLRRHWYNIGAVVAIGMMVYLFFYWKEIIVLQKLLIMSFIAILIHQFEEYGFPGGEPAIMNMVLQASEKPERYPLNQNSAMITNVLASYVFYLIPIFFPNIIWLGFAPILMGMFQFIVHGIVTNKKLHTIYNPGLGAVVLLHFPIGIYYIYYISSNNLINGWGWLISIIYMVSYAFIFINKMTYTWLADKDSKYIFNEEEMKRFNVREKLSSIKNK